MGSIRSTYLPSQFCHIWPLGLNIDALKKKNSYMPCDSNGPLKTSIQNKIIFLFYLFEMRNEKVI